MRLDTHQHFWRYDPAQHVWMTDAMGVLRRDHLPADLEPRLGAAGFDGTIAVQARQMVEETELAACSSPTRTRSSGASSAGWTCARRRSATSSRGTRGTRSSSASATSSTTSRTTRSCCEPTSAPASPGCGEFDLTYDLLLFPKHLPFAVRLVEEFPEQPFVLDHIAKPLIRDRVLSPWKEDLRRLAAFPNVFCKLSGMVTEARWEAVASRGLPPVPRRGRRGLRRRARS